MNILLFCVNEESCPMCGVVKNQLKNIARLFPEEIKLTIVDPTESIVLAQEYGVSKVPTTYFMKNNQIVHMVEGEF